ncbi:MAG: hypothetical protein ACRDY7_14115, partial [Acidimicrobiia bacterium]
MNKRIALGVAGSLIGMSGVAGASMAVDHSADADADSTEAGITAITELASLSGSVESGTSLPGSVMGLVDDIPGMGVVNQVLPTVCGAVPPLPLPTSTVETAMSFFGSLES